MLIELKVKNLYSFREQILFSMVASKNDYLIENTVKINDDLSLLKTGCIIGTHAQGKSNFINALAYLKHLFYEPDESKIRILSGEYFDGAKAQHNNVGLEVSFYLKGNIYKYKIELYDEKIRREVLTLNNTKPILLINKQPKKIYYNTAYFKERPIEDVYFDKRLLIQHLRGDISQDICVWLSEIVIAKEELYALFWESHKFFCGDPIVKFVKQYDLPLKGLTLTGFELEGFYDGAKNVHRIESNRERLVFFVARVFLTLEAGGLLVVDDIFNEIDPIIAMKLIELFHSAETNPKNAQLIFTTVQPILLDSNFMRKDEIWFMEKNYDRISRLYSLAEFKDVADQEDFTKNYLRGRYGGTPL